MEDDKPDSYWYTGESMTPTQKRWNSLLKVTQDNLNDFFILANLKKGELFKFQFGVATPTIYKKAREHGIILNLSPVSEDYESFSNQIDFYVSRNRMYGPFVILVTGFLK